MRHRSNHYGIVIMGMLSLLVLTLLAGTVFAQSTGQLCVRAFEDRNGNTQRDNNEPPLVRGLSATLRNETGIIVDSILMENSSSSASGTLCFQQLEAGQYSIRVLSADYTATTPNEFIAAVSDSGVPDVLLFGAQLIPVEMPEVATTASQEERLRGTLVRSVFAGIGALVIMGAMTVVGALIYFFALRNRSPRQTGEYQAVQGGTAKFAAARLSGSTGQYRAVQGSAGQPANPTPQPEARRMDAVTFDDTDLPGLAQDEGVRNMYSDDDDFAFDDLDTEDDTNKPFRPPEN
ncbi:MAG: hypothetical protein AAFQ52_10295 [Chloroflexota bacterium]